MYMYFKEKNLHLFFPLHFFFFFFVLSPTNMQTKDEISRRDFTPKRLGPPFSSFSSFCLHLIQVFEQTFRFLVRCGALRNLKSGRHEVLKTRVCQNQKKKKKKKKKKEKKKEEENEEKFSKRHAFQSEKCSAQDYFLLFCLSFFSSGASRAWTERNMRAIQYIRAGGVQKVDQKGSRRRRRCRFFLSVPGSAVRREFESFGI